MEALRICLHLLQQLDIAQSIPQFLVGELLKWIQIYAESALEDERSLGQ